MWLCVLPELPQKDSELISVGLWLGCFGSKREDYLLFIYFLRNSTFALGFSYQPLFGGISLAQVYIMGELQAQMPGSRAP